MGATVMTYGEQIRKLITNSGLTHAEIARRLGIRGSTLQRVMEDRWGGQLETAQKILNYFSKDLKIVSKKGKIN